MPLHENLLSCVDIFPDEDAASGIVNFVAFEDEIWIVKGTEGEGSCQLKEGIRGQNSHHPI